jgi:hypothetical protein
VLPPTRDSNCAILKLGKFVQSVSVTAQLCTTRTSCLRRPDDHVSGHIRKYANDFEQIVKLCTVFKELERGTGRDGHEQVMKVYMGSGGIAPFIHNLGTRWNMSGHLRAPGTYPWGKNPRDPLGGSQGKFWTVRRREVFFLPLTRITPESSTRWPSQYIDYA